MCALDVAEGSSRRRRGMTAALLGLAQIGHAHWFFGNLYEATVKVPGHLASRNSSSSTERGLSLFGPGSPTRYYVPAVPVTFPAAVAALISGWTSRNGRWWLVATAACSISGGVATTYLVRTVNMKLFFNAQPLATSEREALLRTWYRINAFRLVVGGGAWLSAQKARSSFAQSRSFSPAKTTSEHLHGQADPGRAACSSWRG